MEEKQTITIKFFSTSGYPVQARELTTLQSILQNQVEQFGNHFFKEGAKVIPGDLTYIPNFYAVEVDTEFLGYSSFTLSGQSCRIEDKR